MQKKNKIFKPYSPLLLARKYRPLVYVWNDLELFFFCFHYKYVVGNMSQEPPWSIMHWAICFNLSHTTLNNKKIYKSVANWTVDDKVKIFIALSQVTSSTLST